MARTPKALALGAALRQAREAKGLLLRELATAINRDNGVVSRWENGERTPKPEQVAQILTRLEVSGARYDEIMTLAYGTAESQWVAFTLPEQRQAMNAYLDWEQNATSIVEVAPLLVPGLLQIADYVHGLMADAGVPAGEIAARVTARVGRREAITKAKPAELRVLLGENALLSDIGGRSVTIAQLRYLLEVAAWPNVRLQVFPNHRGWHPGLEGDFAVIERKPASIVFVGGRRSVMMLHESSDVDFYKHAVDRIVRVCMSPESSAKFIADVVSRLEKQS